MYTNVVSTNIVQLILKHLLVDDKFSKNKNDTNGLLDDLYISLLNKIWMWKQKKILSVCSQSLSEKLFSVLTSCPLLFARPLNCKTNKFLK